MLDAEALRSVGLPADAVDDTGTLLPQLAQRAIRAAIGGTVRADADALPSYIDLWDRILCSTPQGGSGWANAVASFGAAMQARFDRTGVPDELAVAVEAHRVALGATSADRAGRAACWLNLGRALHTRFGLSALGSDLDEAIHATESAIAAAERVGPVRTIALQNLNTMSRDRYENTGDIADLDRAVDVGFSALNTIPPGHPDRAAHLQNLGISLRARYAHTGVARDLDAAVEALGEAVGLASEAAELGAYLSSHGAALLARFNRAGRMTDLDTAVELSRRATAVASLDNPDQAVYFLNLCAALLTRFRSTGSVDDLDESVAAAAQGIAATGLGHPRYADMLWNFGSCLSARFDFLHDLADIDLAVGIHREAMAATPEGHPDRASHLSIFGASLHAQAEKDNRPDALNEVVDIFRQAVAATPINHPERVGRLDRLGSTLTSRFEHTGAAPDLDEAVVVLREAVATAPVDHPDRTRWLADLGLALWRRYRHYGHQEDLDDAAKASAEATRVLSAPPIERIKAARIAAIVAEQNNDPADAADLLEAAVRSLPELVPRRLPRPDQQARLAAVAGLANRAAAAALASPATPASHRAGRAMTLLEAGRAVLLSQSLETRGDLTDLRAVRPDLATRFAELTDRLNQHTAQRVHTDPVAGRTKSISERFVIMSEVAGRPDSAHTNDAADRIRLAEELAEGIRRIREVDGFASFGLPPDAGELLAEAAHGPLVAFTVTADHGNALIVTDDRIECVELPGLTTEVLAERVSAFHRALRRATRSPSARDLRPFESTVDGQAELRAVLEWLWDSVTGPVLDHLGLRRTPSENARRWPRIWWIPCGQLALLPLHAAGYHADPATPTRRAVMDRVMSSYTSTVGALRHARRSPATARPPQRSLVVAMPTTPGLHGGGQLPHVRVEVDVVASLLPDPLVLSTPPDPAYAVPGSALPAALPTARRVLDELPSSAIAHFACHGTHHPTEPAASTLLLYDHAEAPLTVAHLAPVALDHAQLAYLSACETALNKVERFLDEAIHLAGAFQLAGFPHVIGTLWAVDDEFAAVIASRFYRGLHDQHTATVTVGDAARVLHEVVRALRDDFPDTPSLWAAHLHFGP
ncbi:CHAT domain-containing protein [Micromonospora rubida]